MFQQPSHKLLSTPENPAPDTYVYRRVRIPDDLQWKILVNGVLSLLAEGRSYEPTPDGVSVEDTTAVFREMFLDYSESEGSWVIGAILPFAGASLPTNMLWCDGTTYDRSGYETLYNLLHSSLIVDGTQFKTPDLRDRFPIGWDGNNTGGNTGADGGEALHMLTAAEMPTHTHIQDAHTHVQNSHNHTQNAHTHVQDSHNHTQNAHTHVQDAHTHVQNSHAHSSPNHNHGTVAHTHEVTDPGHVHGLNSHIHNILARASSTPGTAAQLMRGSATGTDSNINTAAANPTSTASVGAGISLSSEAPDTSSTIVTINGTTAVNQNATATNQNTTATNNAATATNQNATATNIATTATNQNAIPTNQNAGGGQAHNNLPPYLAVRYVIIAK